MKSCPYCGKEYPDDETICSIDRNPLLDNNLQPPVSNEQIVAALPDKNAPYLTFPDYQWSARDAWKCAGMIILLGGIYWMIVFALSWCFPEFHNWRSSGFGYF